MPVLWDTPAAVAAAKLSGNSSLARLHKIISSVIKGQNEGARNNRGSDCAIQTAMLRFPFGFWVSQYWETICTLLSRINILNHL